jgi:hypothetical protein
MNLEILKDEGGRKENLFFSVKRGENSQRKSAEINLEIEENFRR